METVGGMATPGMQQRNKLIQLPVREGTTQSIKESPTVKMGSVEDHKYDMHYRAYERFVEKRINERCAVIPDWFAPRFDDFIEIFEAGVAAQAARTNWARRPKVLR